ncbi:hypothetical protein BDDG_12188, partial [Blastomyces dermatitidis ATCC 18188]
TDIFIFIHIKSLHIDRSAFTDDSELNIESLIENLKNVIMKKLSVLCVTESFMSLSVSSVTSFSAAFSQSSTLISVSDSPASATSISATLTFTTSTLTAAFVTSSSHFKKILCKLSELHFSAKDICVFRNENTDVVLFYIYRYKTYISYLRYYYKNKLFTH